MVRDVGKWELLSGPHKNGGRHIGIRILPDAADQLRAQGFMLANKMYERGLERGEVANVRIGDVLDVRFDGEKRWYVWRGDVRLGQLTWSTTTFEERDWHAQLPRIDDGTLQVIKLGLDASGQVVNAGGIVRPRGVRVPPVKRAVPYAQVHVPTLRATVSSDGVVDVQGQNLPGAPRVGSAPVKFMMGERNGFWSRLFGR